MDDLGEVVRDCRLASGHDFQKELGAPAGLGVAVQPKPQPQQDELQTADSFVEEPWGVARSEQYLSAAAEKADEAAGQAAAMVLGPQEL